MILLTNDNKKVKINPTADLALYKAPKNPPNTGTKYLTGVDLYAHKARSGNWYYYTYSWSLWQGSEDHAELVSSEKAIDFLLQRATLLGPAGLNDIDIRIINEYFGKDIFAEDA